MSKDKPTKTKYATVRAGKACLIFMYICAVVVASTGLAVLLHGDAVGYGILGILLLVFVPIIVLMHFHNCGNTVTFVDEKIIGKRKTLTWDTAFLTIHCHKFLGSRATFVWLYFDDHYLTEKEVRSFRVARQGLCLRLNSEEAYFIRSHCKHNVKVLNYGYGLTEGSDALYILYSYDSEK